ncbi:roadblock/LC7 domain-containing protein [Dyella sp.]|uniref:roadblock/LC7 domain-containing protein n=1 Tax=Dyella sp. TaxID=1869338 RepID=UPI002ED4A3D7
MNTNRSYRNRYSAILQRLVDSSEPVTIALLAQRDGRAIETASASGSTVLPTKLAAMTSATAALSQTLLREVAQDRMAMTLIEGKAGIFLAMPVVLRAATLLLGVHAGDGVSLGRLVNYTRRTVIDLQSITVS